jgi:hypothetical protein
MEIMEIGKFGKLDVYINAGQEARVLILAYKAKAGENGCRRRPRADMYGSRPERTRLPRPR